MTEISPTEAEGLARLFHETYERLAPQFSYETRKASAVPWEQVPENNRTLMIAVAGEILAKMPKASPEASHHAELVEVLKQVASRAHAVLGNIGGAA